jgi:hypothetical protein
MTSIASIGYEAATLPSFLAVLQQAGIELVVDVRAVASSRRPGFAKSRLAATLLYPFRPPPFPSRDTQTSV